MKIGRPFNQLSKSEYFHYIDNHKKYTDFNTLGLYRSLVEHEKLSLEEKLEIRDYAHRTFQKTFDFLQLKDPVTFIEVTYLGEELTNVEWRQAFDRVRENQQRILEKKRFGHRNFGTYSKHNCGSDWCPYNGMMVREGSVLCESSMNFKSDARKKWGFSYKVEDRSKFRSSSKQIIKDDWRLDESE